MKMLNGTLEFEGVEGMKAHYNKIWATFLEQLTVEKFVSNKNHVAIQMWAHFEALKDDEQSVFGAVLKGETFDFRGLILYDVREGKFATITVAYNSFIFTNIKGEQTMLGIPH